MTQELTVSRLAPFTRCVENGFNPDDAAQAFRKTHNIAEPGSEGFRQIREAWTTSQDRPVILVVGAGKAGEVVASELIKRDVHPVVISRDPVHGGMAAEAINSSLHPAPKINTLKAGGTTLADPRLDTLFGLPVPLDNIQGFAARMGFKGVVWCAGAEPRRMEGIDYNIRGVHDVLSFLLPHNRALDYGNKGLTQVADEMGYRFDQDEVAYPTFIQAGGKSGEDIAVADRTFRIVFALQRLGLSTQVIDRFNAKAFFKKAGEVGFEEALGAIGLTLEDVGETVLVYHGDVNQMNLFPPSSVKIDNEVKNRKEQNEKRHSEDGYEMQETGRREVVRDLKAQNMKKVPAEVQRWARAYGITLRSDRRACRISEQDGSLAIHMGVLQNKTQVVGDECVRAGLFVSSAGFIQPELPNGNIPIVAAGMASGTGALADSIHTAREAVTDLLVRISANGSGHVPYRTVLGNIASLQEAVYYPGGKNGNGITEDAVGRLFRLGPNNLLPHLVNSREDS